MLKLLVKSEWLKAVNVFFKKLWQGPKYASEVQAQIQEW